MFTFPRPAARSAVLAIMLGTTILASSSFAASMDPTMGNPATSNVPTVNPTASKHHNGMKEDPAVMMKQHVETRISTLHSELKITSDQESQWQTVAQTMRDNEETMSKLVQARHTSTNMTAIDDLKSYQAIAQAHADGITKMISAFEPLYTSMSDDQKKTADEFFGKIHQGHMHKHMMHTTSAPTEAPAAQ